MLVKQTPTSFTSLSSTENILSDRASPSLPSDYFLFYTRKVPDLPSMGRKDGPQTDIGRACSDLGTRSYNIHILLHMQTPFCVEWASIGPAITLHGLF